MRSKFSNLVQFLHCARIYLSKARKMTFDDVHKHRAYCTQELLNRLEVTFDMENVEGLQVKKPCIYVANHTSLLDILVLCSNFPYDVRFLAKAELFKVPCLSSALKVERHIPVYRGSKDSNAIEKLKQSMKTTIGEGGCVAIFPEGTRTATGELGKFKLGAFYAAVQNDVPIVPVALKGLFEIMPKDSGFRIKPGHCHAVVLPAIEAPKEGSERERAEALRDMAYNAIKQELEK